MSWLRPKYVMFGIIGLMFVYVLGHNERFLIDAKDPEWPHIQPFKWWLLRHGVMGAYALLLGGPCNSPIGCASVLPGCIGLSDDFM
jgi:hypothetical protein